MKPLTVRLLATVLIGTLGFGPTPVYAALSFEARTIDGVGNNATNTGWGSTDTQLLRVTSVEYFDDIAEPRGGTGAISARAISNAVVAQTTDSKNVRGLSDMFWQWGQFVDHDIDLTDNSVPAEAYPISVPTGDPYFDPMSTGTQTIGFNRSKYDHTTGTSTNNPRQQINEITAFLDGSNVYGSDQARADALRTFSGGLLKTSVGNLLPFNTPGLPNAMSTSSVFFLAGDVRANEQPGLTALHTLFMREHNRLAEEITLANPSLTDEEVYQTARRTVGALIQSVTYNEFLPALFGSDILPAYTGYDDAVDPSIANEFSTAAYRLGHSMISPEVLRLDANGLEAPEGHLDLKTGFFNPAILQSTGIESLLRGLPAQVMQEVDSREIDALRNFLFGPPGSGGFDLASLNIQRGRDHGLASYNQARRDLGLAAKTSFSEITSDAAMASALESVYNGNIEDVDLWVGGLTEDHVPGSSVGETFTTIIADQFTRMRDGDRFWYENQFNGAELDTIRATTLKDIIERNTDIEHLQDNVFFAQYPEADLEITDTDIPSLVLSGSVIPLDVTVRNNGPLTASGILLHVDIPNNVQFTATGSSAGCTTNGPIVDCAITPLLDDESTVVTVIFEPTEAACFSSIIPYAEVEALQFDSNLANNDEEDIQSYYACPGPNDLDLEASIGSSVSAQRGSSFTTLATVTNNGPAASTGALLSVSIPSNIDVNSVSQPNCSLYGQQLDCTDIDLAMNESFSVDIEFTIPENSTCPRDLTLTATATPLQQQDYFGSNNTASSETHVECEPENDLSISLSGTSETPRGSTVFYTATVTNSGPAIAAVPVTSFSLPSGMTFSAGNSTAGCIQNGANIDCSLSPLADGDTTNATVAFNPLDTLPCGAEVELHATVDSTERDTNTANNTSATVQTEFTCTPFQSLNGGEGGNAGTFDLFNHDTVGNSNSPGATRGKGTSEAMFVLHTLSNFNGMGGTTARTGHFRLANNADAMSNLVSVGSDRTVIIDGWSKEERNVICGMKSYMEDQDPRKRKTEGFRDWLIGQIAQMLHRTEDDVRNALSGDVYCR